MKTMMTLAAALAASTATAQITSEDDAIFGVDSITRDAAQQLDFLDLTLSTNRSFDDVNTQFGAGGDFEGWRYATDQEVVDLINNWGFSPGASVISPSSTGGQFQGNTGSDQLSGLVLLLGNTQSDASGSNARGILSTQLSNPGSLRTISVADRVLTGGNSIIFMGNIPSFTANDAFGHWLVRPVPTPSTAAILGVAGLAATRRRR